MKKKSKGKGLSVLSGRALYDYDATLFAVRSSHPHRANSIMFHSARVWRVVLSTCILAVVGDGAMFLPAPPWEKPMPPFLSAVLCRSPLKLSRECQVFVYVTPR